MATEILEGSRTSFGPRTVETKAPSVVNELDRYLVVPFNYDDLPSVSAVDETIQKIPANSFIKRALLEVTTPFAGVGTETYNIGLTQPDGTAIDVDGFFAAVGISTLGTVGIWSVGGGALVGATTGAADGQVTAAASAGTITAGAGRLIIEYIEPSV